MKNAGTGIAIFLGLHLACAGVPHAQTTGAPVSPEELSRQQGIYQSKGADVPRGYVIDRDLAAYGSALPPEFNRNLSTLGPADRWLDIGAGEGRAILDYYGASADESRKKAQGVAVSIEDRRTPTWHQTAERLEANKIRYFYGKSLNDYSMDELGKFQIITDLLGGFSYTRRLSRFMEKTLGFLHVNGSFYSILQDVHSEEGSNQPHYTGAPYLTEIINTDGSRMKICAWLKSISCVQVTCELRPRWTPPVEVYRVQKVCDNVSVPALSPLHYAAGTPPERRFQLQPASPTSPAQNATPPQPARQ
jgi:hypothetical protein